MSLGVVPPIATLWGHFPHISAKSEVEWIKDLEFQLQRQDMPMESPTQKIWIPSQMVNEDDLITIFHQNPSFHVPYSIAKLISSHKYRISLFEQDLIHDSSNGQFNSISLSSYIPQNNAERSSSPINKYPECGNSIEAEHLVKLPIINSEPIIGNPSSPSAQRELSFHKARGDSRDQPSPTDTIPFISNEKSIHSNTPEAITPPNIQPLPSATPSQGDSLTSISPRSPKDSYPSTPDIRRSSRLATKSKESSPHISNDKSRSRKHPKSHRPSAVHKHGNPHKKADNSPAKVEADYEVSNINNMITTAQQNHTPVSSAEEKAKNTGDQADEKLPLEILTPDRALAKIDPIVGHESQTRPVQPEVFSPQRQAAIVLLSSTQSQASPYEDTSVTAVNPEDHASAPNALSADSAVSMASSDTLPKIASPVFIPNQVQFRRALETNHQDGSYVSPDTLSVAKKYSQATPHINEARSSIDSVNLESSDRQLHSVTSQGFNFKYFEAESTIPIDENGDNDIEKPQASHCQTKKSLPNEKTPARNTDVNAPLFITPPSSNKRPQDPKSDDVLSRKKNRPAVEKSNEKSSFEGLHQIDLTKDDTKNNLLTVDLTDENEAFHSALDLALFDGISITGIPSSHLRFLQDAMLCFALPLTNSPSLDVTIGLFTHVRETIDLFAMSSQIPAVPNNISVVEAEIIYNGRISCDTQPIITLRHWIHLLKLHKHIESFGSNIAKGSAYKSLAQNWGCTTPQSVALKVKSLQNCKTAGRCLSTICKQHDVGFLVVLLLVWNDRYGDFKKWGIHTEMAFAALLKASPVNTILEIVAASITTWLSELSMATKTADECKSSFDRVISTMSTYDQFWGNIQRSTLDGWYHTDKYQIFGESILCLRKKAWLNHDAINMALAMHPFPQHIAIWESIDVASSRSQIRNIQRRASNLTKDTMSIVCPIHTANHWLLMQIDLLPDTYAITFFTSLESGLPIHQIILLQGHVQQIMQLSCKTPTTLSNTTHGRCIKQINSYDCGILTIANAFKAGGKILFPKDVHSSEICDDLRLEIARNILSQPWSVKKHVT